MNKSSSRSAFTLIELLVVIAIVAVLSIVVILVINPVELFRQARDATRLSDLDTLNHALNLYQADVTVNPSLGDASTTYLSLVDIAATTTAGTNCATMGFPPLAGGFSYHCAASSTVRNVDGTGWVPVNFNAMSFGSALAVLPVDPVNTTTTGNYYYTYTPGGSWEMTSLFESQKYIVKESQDGGSDPLMYEMGTNIALSPFARGMIAYWPYDDGAGTIVSDASRGGNTAKISLGGTGFWTTGKVGGAYTFDGSHSATSSALTWENLVTDKLTLIAWVNPNATTSNYAIFGVAQGSCGACGPGVSEDHAGDYRMSLTTTVTTGSLTGGSWIQGTWTQEVLTYDGATFTSYRNGLAQGSQALTGTMVRGSGGPVFSMSGSFIGSMDDVRIYNRVLSAAEITAVYNATK